jgi:putative transposase
LTVDESVDPGSFYCGTLEDALARYGKPEIFNTDPGSQFTGTAFTSVLIKNGTAISMDGKGAWRDNVWAPRSAWTATHGRGGAL